MYIYVRYNGFIVNKIGTLHYVVQDVGSPLFRQSTMCI